MLALSPLLNFYPDDSLAISNVNDIKAVGFKEKLSEKADISTSFYNSAGNKVTLADYFDGKRPVILNLVYFTCPRVCTFGTDGVLEAVNELDSLDLGKDYRVLTISFNDEENTGIANTKSGRYLNSLREDLKGTDSWEFLTGDEKNIVKLTNSVGFKFKEDGEEFAHPSGIIILTPEGKISRYLYGIQYNAKDLRLALVEASDGKIGESSVLNEVLLFCYEFDPVGKKYALQALNVVKAGGFITLVVLVSFLSIMWKRNRS